VAEYPRGKLNPNDEGALNIAMGMNGDTFIIDFGKPVVWIGMSRKEAQDFAMVILRHVADGYVKLEIPEDGK
jgi:hypothetical protein